jgi:hypothetical protein
MSVSSPGQEESKISLFAADAVFARCGKAERKDGGKVWMKSGSAQDFFSEVSRADNDEDVSFSEDFGEIERGGVEA